MRWQSLHSWGNKGGLSSCKVVEFNHRLIAGGVGQVALGVRSLLNRLLPQTHLVRLLARAGLLLRHCG